MSGKFFCIVSICLALVMLGGDAAEARIFTGHFQGRGRGCWGDIWIRTKTIQWLSDWSDCYAPYTIVKQTFSGEPRNFDYIIYKLNRPGKSCSWRYIGLYYYEYSVAPGSQDYWSVAGFPSYADYKNFDYRSAITGGGGNEQDKVLFCDLPQYFDITNQHLLSDKPGF